MLGILFYVLTPHVLSDGNVEWCSFNVCWNPVGVFISGYVLSFGVLMVFLCFACFGDI